MMPRFNFLLIFLTASFLFSSCSNPFAYKPSNWKQVSESDKEDKEKYTVAYIDENRVEQTGDEVQAWTKLVFATERPVGFSGSKPGEISGDMKVKRVDSSVKFDCKKRLMTVISYQLYDSNDKMFDSKWINFQPEYVKPGTINYDLMKSVCKNIEEEK